MTKPELCKFSAALFACAAALLAPAPVPAAQTARNVVLRPKCSRDEILAEFTQWKQNP